MIRETKICVDNHRNVNPKSVKLANQYESLTNVLKFEFEFTIPEDAHIYMVLEDRCNDSTYYAPLIDGIFVIDNSLTWDAEEFEAHILITQKEITNGNVAASQRIFVSDSFTLYSDQQDMDLTKLEKQEFPQQIQLVYDQLLDYMNNTPYVEVQKAAGGHNVIFNNIDGKKTFFVSDGGYGFETEISQLKESISNLSTGGLTSAQVNALDGMFKVVAYVKDDVSGEYNAFKNAFNIGGSDEEDEIEYALSRIPFNTAYFGVKWNEINKVVLDIYGYDGITKTTLLSSKDTALIALNDASWTIIGMTNFVSSKTPSELSDGARHVVEFTFDTTATTEVSTTWDSVWDGSLYYVSIQLWKDDELVKDFRPSVDDIYEDSDGKLRCSHMIDTVSGIKVKLKKDGENFDWIAEQAIELS